MAVSVVYIVAQWQCLWYISWPRGSVCAVYRVLVQCLWCISWSSGSVCYVYRGLVAVFVMYTVA